MMFNNNYKILTIGGVITIMPLESLEHWDVGGIPWNLSQ